jgi:division protein CdvB (Snf7/Vps24/ESCRT-III family)
MGGGHQLMMMPESGLVDRKPPIDMTKKTKHRMDPVLKIEEDLDDAVVVMRETATQTSPILGKLRSINHTKGSVMTLWTSEESILHGADNVDEDNK